MKAKLNTEQDNEIVILYKKGNTAQQIADRFGVYKQVILNALKRRKIQRRKNWKRASGSKNGQWKGGVRIIKGYRLLLMPHHHLALIHGYVPEHRLIMEEKLGRKLLPNEVVNHIDKNTLNNTPENLEVFENNGKHIAHHIKSGDFKRDKLGRFANE